ncbi:MAG: bifunctional methylenetetrahydrofolate dehydrogenase/methenyltetrahydrofolate cyclohydrolase FolD [Pontiellaceae bacterium]|jgi:methylenetetrahydrofolate dehydrogenase (NADP+)/methenyltetrahydrofolate cyclohydrolase|nr:bifunctional methylenetetrahydrofolate dehydrogenase/methenyltetrahydrofolate cyclohydrolase FolD [Pontiellaceae bacterium]
MSAKILDGKAIAQDIRAELKIRTAALREQGIVPGLGVLLVGDDPASRSYVTAKEKACGETGLYSREIKLPSTASHKEILDVVHAFNADDRIDGILVQLPLPDSSMEQSVIEAINPEKDVDGFHPVNVGRMMLGLPAFLPCTPHGVLQILKRSGIKTDGAHAVVIGRSNIVGRPLVNLLSQKSELGNATVTMCHTRTKNMKELTLQADIIVAAAGRPNTVTADMVKPGAVVIDVGVNRIEDAAKKSGYRLAGDVDFEAVSQKASAITPVPGGVGPMTITMLLANTVESAMRRHPAK